MSRYIVRLDSKSALQEACAGGKGASLAWLCRNGFNVPPGFVITSATFQDFLADFEIKVLTRDEIGQRAIWSGFVNSSWPVAFRIDWHIPLSVPTGGLADG